MSKENLNAVIRTLNYRKWLAYLFPPKSDAIIVNGVTILFFTTLMTLKKGQEIIFLTDLNNLVVIFVFCMLMLRMGNIAMAFLSKIKLIHGCILLLGLVGICIKLSTALSGEIEHERKPSVKAHDLAINSIMPKGGIHTLNPFAADNNIYHVMHRVGNKANKIDAINPYTNREFIGEGRLHPTLPHHPCVTHGTRCWQDLQKLKVWLDKVRKQRSDILNEQG